MADFPFFAVIPGAPIGKGRGRAAVVGGHARIYTPKRTAEWERGTAFVLRGLWKDVPFDGPVEVRLLAAAPRPKRLMRKKDPDGLIWKPKTPDADNIEKCTWDAIVMAGIIRDDCLVVKSECQDCYAEKDGIPRIEIMIRPLQCEPKSFIPKGQALSEVNSDLDDAGDSCDDNWDIACF